MSPENAPRISTDFPGFPRKMHFGFPRISPDFPGKCTSDFPGFPRKMKIREQIREQIREHIRGHLRRVPGVPSSPGFPRKMHLGAGAVSTATSTRMLAPHFQERSPFGGSLAARGSPGCRLTVARGCLGQAPWTSAWISSWHPSGLTPGLWESHIMCPDPPGGPRSLRAHGRSGQRGGGRGTAASESSRQRRGRCAGRHNLQIRVVSDHAFSPSAI